MFLLQIGISTKQSVKLCVRCSCYKDNQSCHCQAQHCEDGEIVDSGIGCEGTNHVLKKINIPHNHRLEGVQSGFPAGGEADKILRNTMRYSVAEFIENQYEASLVTSITFLIDPVLLRHRITT